MKTKFLLLLFLISSPVCLLAQEVHFQKIKVSSLPAGLESPDKPIFIYFKGPEHPPGSIPAKAYASLFDAPVAKFLNTNFNCISLDFMSAGNAALLKKYSVNTYPAFLFLDSAGGFVSRSSGMVANSDFRLRMLKQALDLIHAPDNLAKQDRRHAAGEHSAAFLHAYILAREAQGLYNNAALADEYVGQLNLAEIGSTPQLLFLFQAGPAVESGAMKAMNLNLSKKDSIFKALPLNERIMINRRIIANSVARAVETKDKQLPWLVARFVAATYSDSRDYRKGYQEQTRTLLDIYSQTGDTAHYLSNAGQYYDLNYMNISVDSARRLQAAQTRLISDSQHRPPVPECSSCPITSVRVTQTLVTGPAGNQIAAVLNNAAWGIYKTGTANATYILKAIGWTRRALEIEPTWFTYDTYAHLLYAYGFNEQAEAEMKKALEMAKSNKAPKTEQAIYTQELRLVKARKLNRDALHIK